MNIFLIIFFIIIISLYTTIKSNYKTRFIRYFNEKKIALIHVGKCGGTSVKKELNLKKINYIHIHMFKAEYNPNYKYVIILRNPVKRFISAFYWRHYLITNKFSDKDKKGVTQVAPNGTLKAEQDFFKKYHNINDFCVDLSKNDNILENFKVINHMNMGIDFYLNKLINTCPKKNILGVICLETLDHDMKKIFNIDIKSHYKNNYNYDKAITPKNYNILKFYLENDYNIINKMYQQRLLILS